MFRMLIFLSCVSFAGFAQAKSQQLLDDLAQSSSAQSAKPIISALWEIWTNEYETDIEKDLMKRGVDEMAQGNLELAEVTFGQLIKENPDFTEAWNKRATIRFMMGDFEASRLDVHEVLSREPRHFGAISGLGMIYMHLGDFEAAINTYRKLESVFPASPEARRYLPILKKRLGRADL